MGFQFWIQFAPIVVLLILGFTIGTLVERAHFKRLAVREAALKDMFVTNLKSFPPEWNATSCGLVTGEVVIASDYFKTFAAGLRKLIGGELHTYESLMVRARREALARMMESAKGQGANCVASVRFSTTNIGSARRRRAAAMVEMYAYGTAMYVTDPSPR